MSTVVQITQQEFDQVISSGTKKVLVDCYAEWCGPCKMMMPVLESIEDKIDIIKVNIDEHEDLAKEYRIMSIPTLVFFKDGEIQEELVGFRSKEELEEIIDKY